MKILILSGGTGSINLQRGLATLMGDNFIHDTTVLVNAYDNGLSTGVVRKVYDGKLLGPSDVRKNQTHRLMLLNSKTDFQSALIKLLDIRFSSTSKDAAATCAKWVDHHLGKFATSEAAKVLAIKEAFVDYFRRPMASLVTYDDFSIANIIYAGLSAGSLRLAARRMAQIMDIPDNVILNDDTSLFLGAITASNHRIYDEGEIVSWSNSADPIVNVFFGDEGRPYGRMPSLDPEAAAAIAEADLIIMSSGTQWSSLIPTYATLGIRDALSASKAHQVLVMNRTQDKDALGVSASDILHTLKKYLDTKQINVLVDSSADEFMSSVNDYVAKSYASVISMDMKPLPHDKASTHNPRTLSMAIMASYFKDALNSNTFMFDYDDTIAARNQSDKSVARSNMAMLQAINNKQTVNVAICTGNSINAIDVAPVGPTSNEELDKWVPLNVYAEGGVNSYNLVFVRSSETGNVAASRNKLESLPEMSKLLFSEEEVQAIIYKLKEIDISSSLISVRGNGAAIAIKPIDPTYRTIIVNLLQQVKLWTFDAEIIATGKTTIEIVKSRDAKAHLIRALLAQKPESTFTFIGDEMCGGNDECVRILSTTEPRVKCLAVNNPLDTQLFLRVLSQKEGIGAIV